MASREIESLFTKILSDKTINIINDSVDKHQTICLRKIQYSIFGNLHLACTMKAPFYDHKGNIYTQTNGVNRGKPLGPAFANFTFYPKTENSVFITIYKPDIYISYVDDICILKKIQIKW